ncbi:MAG: hypothetical protein ACK47B_15890 [Armatimonadota bacterium]
MGDETGGPIYDEKQAGAILKRAVERSAAAGAERSSGISLAEMERIAAEIGIDPRHVRAAAAEVAGRSAAGTAGVIDLEQVVPAELTEEAWDSILAELRRLFGDAGTASAVGRAREWDLRQDTINVHASVVSRGGSTRVHLLENHSTALSLAWLIWLIVSLIAAGLAALGGASTGGLDQALINALLTGGVSGAAYLGIRASAQRWQRRQQERMEGLLQRVAGLIRQHQPGAADLTPTAEAQELPEAAEAVQPVVVRGA